MVSRKDSTFIKHTGLIYYAGLGDVAVPFTLVGQRSHNLVEQPLVKLKAVYTFAEQLYIGGSRCIMAAKNTKAPPQLIVDMLKELSIVPKWFEEWKKAACRHGALTALARAKAYAPELDPAQLVAGYLEFDVDDSPFTKKDFLRCVKETRVAATGMTEEINLSKYQAGYSESNKRIESPNPQPVALTRPRKQTFTPDVEPSPVLMANLVFEALQSIQWHEDDLQAAEAEETVPEDEAPTQD